MKTIIKKIDIESLKEDDLKEAIIILKKGGLVAFPTETVYGLGANALDAEAAKKIYLAKGRPSDNPLIVHIARIEALQELAKEIPETAFQIAETFWPGPLTIILKKKDCIPYSTTGGLETVAIRMPSHQVARKLIDYSGIYIAAPSANISGRPSPTNAEHVIEDLNGKIDMILDSGSVEIGIESTIVDLTGSIPIILRPGYITKDSLERIVGNIEVDKAILERKVSKDFVPKAPGMKYKHYAPNGQLIVVEGEENLVIDYIVKEAEKKITQKKKVGIIATEETKGFYKIGIVKCIGSKRDETSIAKALYGILREFDQDKADYIYTESFPSKGLGQAIMNRLLKAAGYQIVSVKEKI